MSGDRLYLLRLRWGLVSLGAFAFITLRFTLAFLEHWGGFRDRTDWRVLSSRMSQLKPYPWKAAYSGPYAVLLVVLLAGTIGVLLVLGLRDAFASEREADEREAEISPAVRTDDRGG